MDNKIRLLNSKYIFTAQQKINTNFCFILLFSSVINRKEELQISVIQYFIKFHWEPLSVLLLLFSLLPHCYLLLFRKNEIITKKIN